MKHFTVSLWHVNSGKLGPIQLTGNTVHRHYADGHRELRKTEDKACEIEIGYYFASKNYDPLIIHLAKQLI